MQVALQYEGCLQVLDHKTKQKINKITHSEYGKVRDKNIVCNKLNILTLISLSSS